MEVRGTDECGGVETSTVTPDRNPGLGEDGFRKKLEFKSLPGEEGRGAVGKGACGLCTTTTVRVAKNASEHGSRPTAPSRAPSPGPLRLGRTESDHKDRGTRHD